MQRLALASLAALVLFCLLGSGMTKKVCYMGQEPDKSQGDRLRWVMYGTHRERCACTSIRPGPLSTVPLKRSCQAFYTDTPIFTDDQEEIHDYFGCHESPCLSRTLLGCCENPGKLGLEDGTIPDENITASSNWNNNDKSTPSGGRLNKLDPGAGVVGAWAPAESDTKQWIQVDLGIPTCVHGVLIQGRDEHDGQWVTRFTVSYQPSPAAMFTNVLNPYADCVVKEFDGNTDHRTIVERLFAEPIVGSTVRINPVHWNSFIALRFELLGCRNCKA